MKKIIQRKVMSLIAISATVSSMTIAAEEAAMQPGTILFKINESAAPNELKGLNALLKAQGLVSSTTMKGSALTVAKFNAHGREKAIATLLEKSGYVEFAQPDYIVEPILQPNDPSFSNQWHHNNIKSQQAWDVTTGNNVVVAVCDTGFDVNHPDLAPNLRTDLAYNAQDDSTYIFDANGHGTGTAGSLGAVGNNATGVAGVNWNVDIIPVRIAISDSNSSAYISTMAKCIEYAADNGARIVNLSYGGIQYAAIDSAAQYLRSKGGLLFMSAGNDGQEFASYPDYSSFIGVGATDQNDNRASFSSYGNYVDITAPGVSIRTTYPDNRYVNYSGTSFSSPIAAGVGALMIAANPSITVEQIEAGIFSTAIDIGASGDDNVFGHGLIDAAAAVNYAINIGSVTAPTSQITVSAARVSFGTDVFFSGLNSYDDDGDIVNYAWNFGDGTTSEQAELSHTYGATGAYQASLTVTDNDGLTNTSSVTVTVTTELPNAVISDISTSYSLGDTIAFDATASTDPDGSIVDYAWSFGDGAEGNGALVEHTYTATGSYQVVLTVTDNAGAINTDTVMVNVTDPLSLSAPSNLTAQTSGLSVALSWQDTNTSETQFIVERGEKLRGKVRFSTIASLPENSESYTDAVPRSGDYHYRVTAANSSNAATSSVLRVSVSEAGTPPPSDLAAPSNLIASLDGSNVTLSWTDNATSELGFYIERGLKEKGKVSYERIAIVAQNAVQYTDSTAGIVSGNYSYRVSAYNDEGTSAYSNTSEARVK